MCSTGVSAEARIVTANHRRAGNLHQSAAELPGDLCYEQTAAGQPGGALVKWQKVQESHVRSASFLSGRISLDSSACHEGEPWDFNLGRTIPILQRRLQGLLIQKLEGRQGAENAL